LAIAGAYSLFDEVHLLLMLPLFVFLVWLVDIRTRDTTLQQQTAKALLEMAMDSQADLSLREAALCYILYPKNKSRSAHTYAQVHRATPHSQPDTGRTDIVNHTRLTTHDARIGGRAANDAHLGLA
jgi:hypothetical protein